MPVERLIFRDAEKARNAITLEQRREIHDLYLDWADEINDFANHYPEKTTKAMNPALVALAYAGLQKMLDQSGDRIAGQVEGIVLKNMYRMSETVATAHVKWMVSVGYSETVVKTGMSFAPEAIVQRVATGKIYDSNWNLSSAIWGDNEQTHRQIREIIAGGMKEGKPIHEISKDLERYVNPDKAKPWNLRNAQGRKIYPRDVDYNAQRLARTQVQHAYQQSVIEAARNNKNATGIRWNANGPRVCPICIDRDGKIFPIDDVPMDHPNGMCVWEIILAENWKENL
jgi:SPP1 gp7 family putative phage head morphogenesis protein